MRRCGCKAHCHEPYFLAAHIRLSYNPHVGTAETLRISEDGAETTDRTETLAIFPVSPHCRSRRPRAWTRRPHVCLSAHSNSGTVLLRMNTSHGCPACGLWTMTRRQGEPGGASCHTLSPPCRCSVAAMPVPTVGSLGVPGPSSSRSLRPRHGWCVEVGGFIMWMLVAIGGWTAETHAQTQALSGTSW